MREEAARFVAVKVDGTEDTPAFQALTEKYGIVGMPTVVFIDARGREVPMRVTAAIEPAEMLAGAPRGRDRVRGDGAGAAGPARAAGPGAPVVACATRW